MTESSDRRKHPHAPLALLDRQTWRLWALSLTVTGSLAMAIAVVFYPAIRWQVVRIETRHGVLPQLILGLLTLVFLQGAYIIKKQRELNELRDYIIASHTEAALLGNSFPRDSLTGVLDRRTLPDVVKRETAWVDRYRIPLCLVLFDIRGFGKINEKAGNLAGDVVLKDLANTLQATLRQSDSVLRHGPDEFLCFLPRTDRAGGEGFIRRVLKQCQQVSRLRALTLDFGLSVYESGMGADAVIADVERNLAAKKLAPSRLPVPQGSAVQPS